MEKKQEEINIATIERMLERNKELEDIILQIRVLIDSGETDDFVLSRIDTILFGWK